MPAQKYHIFCSWMLIWSFGLLRDWGKLREKKDDRNGILQECRIAGKNTHTVH